MPTISRRTFLAAGASLAAAPALAQGGGSHPDIVVVGAGAAGIAAARRIAAAGRQVVVVEASARIGGRCITDMQALGVPLDLGAHWIRSVETNPVARLAPGAGVDIYPAPPGQRLRIGQRNAREGELEDFLAALVRCNRAIRGAGGASPDSDCARALPKDVGPMLPLVAFVLGPLACSKDLDEVSAQDFARAAERYGDAYCRQGFGTLLSRLAAGLRVETEAPVTQIDSWGRSGVEIATGKGRFSARAVIVTASTNVLASGQVKFGPDLPKRQLDAFAKLSLGSYDRIAIALKGNPLGLQRDDYVLERADSSGTASLLANVSGTSVAYLDVAGSFGRELAARGPRTMVGFAEEWLTNLYGSHLRGAIGRTHATQWNEEPFVQGAWSAASVGGQPSRRVLMEPLRDRIFFAGEAVHETAWGTVQGAWESGERAAAAALRLFGIGPRPERPKPPERPQPRPGRRQAG